MENGLEATRPPTCGDTQIGPSTPRPQLGPSDESVVRGQYEQGHVRAQCHSFMEAMKRHFGEDSKQSITIHDTLGAFRAGRISKKDTHVTIMTQLGDNDGLKQDLMKILYHRDSDWSPGDFYLPNVVHSSTVDHGQPDFLQPQHQPEIRMPSIPTEWYPDPASSVQRSHPSINPSLLRVPVSHYNIERSALPMQHQDIQHSANNGFNLHGNHGAFNSNFTPSACNVPWGSSTQPTFSSPTNQLGNSLYGLNQYDSPVLGQTQNFASPATQLGHLAHVSNQHNSPNFSQGPKFLPYGSSNYEKSSSPFRERSDRPQRSYSHNDAWEKQDAGHIWGTGLRPSLERVHVPFEYQPVHSPVTLEEESGPHRASPHRISPHATPSVLGEPIAIPIGQPSLEVLSSNMCSPIDPQLYSGTFDQGDEEDGLGFQSRSQPPPSQTSSVRKSNSKKPQTRQPSTRNLRAQGQFVHAICGKSFSTRYAVKKHHWGVKTDDIATTTGCWFKNRKPNIEWDAHESCREEPHNSRTLSLPKLEAALLTPTQFTSTMVPAILQNPRSPIPGFPDLRELPSTVAGIINSASTQTIPYHSSRLPARGNFDALLTAANVASQIEAPRPQGRNDSVVSQLDAQAAASERGRRQHSSWSHSPLAPKDMTSAYGTNFSAAAAPQPATSLVSTPYEQDGPVLSNFVLPSQKVQIEHDVGFGAATSSNADNEQNDAQTAHESGHAADSSIVTQDKDAKKRDRSRRSDISKRERKMLGLPVSPGPDAKKLRT